MRFPHVYAIAIVAALTIGLDAPAAELTNDEKLALVQLRELSKRYADSYARSAKPLPKSFSEFLSPEDLRRLTISPASPDATKSSYELFTPAPLLSNISNPASTKLIQSNFKTKDGRRLVAFVDGHVELVDDAAASR
jgi:prepilin-type processing-associated H-X9-DG protein